MKMKKLLIMVLTVLLVLTMTAQPASAGKKTKNKGKTTVYSSLDGTYDPWDMKVSLEVIRDGTKEFGFITAVFGGQVIWTRTTPKFHSGEVDSVAAIGKDDYRYYYSENGDIVCLDLTDGSVKWRNTDFLGYPGKWSSGFAGDGTLFTCGYFGPDLFICDAEGNTVKRIPTLDSEYYWPYELTYYEEEGTVRIVYEGTPSGKSQALYVDLTDYSYSIGEYQEDTPIDGGVYYAKVNEYLSLRAWPSTSADVLDKLFPGTLMMLQYYDSGMAYVQVLNTGDYGYVNPAYIAPAGYDTPGYETATTLIPGALIYADVNEFLSLREAPSTSADVIVRLPDGAAMTVLAEPEGKLVKVRHNASRLEGYVHVDFITF